MTACEWCGKAMTHESARHGHKMHRTCRAEHDARVRAIDRAEFNPLNAALRAWPGGEPRNEWAAPVGVVCWRESLRMVANG
jgi:hypothetical protein